MRDIAFVGFLLAFIALGFRRPFLWVLAYAYVDIVAPQRLSYYLLNSIPVSMIVAGLAIMGWFVADDKRGFKVAPRQWLMLILLIYAGITTLNADFPIEASQKWNWVWKSLFWAIFLPFALRTKLRIEAYLLIMLLSAASIIIVGGMKTAASGGGYGALNLMVTDNSGLYESSTISTVAIAIIPLILWFTRHGTVFPPDWRVKLFAYNLIFACLLIPIGTEARTGLVCIGVLAFLLLRDVKQRVVYIGLIAFAMVAAIPFLPQSFTTRMETISNYEADSSAGTRLAVWGWTWKYVQENPWGGGFEAYLQNQLSITTTQRTVSGSLEIVSQRLETDKGRAYHSSYFEMLGEQGFLGLTLFLLIHGIGLVRLEVLRRKYRRAAEENAWISPLATALQGAQIIYLVGSIFVGMAYQPFIYMLIAVQIGFDTYVTRKNRGVKKKPFFPKVLRQAKENPAI